MFSAWICCHPQTTVKHITKQIKVVSNQNFKKRKLYIKLGTIHSQESQKLHAVSSAQKACHVDLGIINNKP